MSDKVVEGKIRMLILRTKGYRLLDPFLEKFSIVIFRDFFFKGVSPNVKNLFLWNVIVIK